MAKDQRTPEEIRQDTAGIATLLAQLLFQTQLKEASGNDVAVRKVSREMGKFVLEVVDKKPANENDV